MQRAILTIVAMLAMAVPAAGHQSARSLYEAAQTRERALRTRWTTSGAQPTANEVRALVRAYEGVVRRYPASGYCDNALWQAGQLAADAFARFNDHRDRETALRLLVMLPAEYPSSSLASKARDLAQRLRADMLEPPAPSRPAAPATAASPARLRGITREPRPDGARIVILLEREVGYRQERITGPERLVFDLDGTVPARGLSGELDYKDAPVHFVRVGRHPNAVTRVVLDLEGVASYSISTQYEPYRLVVDCVSAAAVPPEPPAAPASLQARPLAQAMALAPALVGALRAASGADAAPAGPERLARPEPPSGPRPLSARRVADGVTLPSPAPASSEDLRAAREEAAARDAAALPVPPSPSSAAVPVPPAANRPGGFSMSRQLGLGVSRVVIDAGHGGHDPGAQSRGASESAIVLDIAMRLEKLLRKQGFDVVLTRRDNSFVQLEERPEFANRHEADMFVSIHANASRNIRAGGVETYYLDFTTNPEAELVAARENAASGRSMNALPDIVKAIALNNKLEESRELATFVQQAMVRRLREVSKELKDLGVKKAPFVVLIGAQMPSILCEVSFITNQRERSLLLKEAYRQRIAEALLEGVEKYQRSLKASRPFAIQDGREPPAPPAAQPSQAAPRDGV